MKPDRKVAAGGIAGALSMIVTWMVEESTGVEIPTHIAQSITVVIAFAVSYYVPNEKPPQLGDFAAPPPKVSKP